jgi:hypothetical protein
MLDRLIRHDSLCAGYTVGEIIGDALALDRKLDLNIRGKFLDLVFASAPASDHIPDDMHPDTEYVLTVDYAGSPVPHPLPA